MNTAQSARMSAGYVCIVSEPGLYTVGFYDPAGKWQPESDHADKSTAANRAAFLNGSGAFAPGTVKDRSDLNDALLDLRARMLRPVSAWNAQSRAEALTLIDRAIGDL